MLKRLTLITAVCLLAACGKSADDYVGYWREQNNRVEEVMEIKHENGNYFGKNLMGINNSLGMARKAVVLDEKDGVLSVQGVPFKLSDDGKSMYIGDRSYTKIDAEFKDKIMAHQSECQKLRDEFSAAQDPLPYDREGNEKRNALQKEYEAKYAELSKEIRCNKGLLGW